MDSSILELAWFCEAYVCCTRYLKIDTICVLSGHCNSDISLSGPRFRAAVDSSLQTELVYVGHGVYISLSVIERVNITRVDLI